MLHSLPIDAATLCGAADRMRSALGTRIELCYVLLRVSFASEANLWTTPRQMRMHRAVEEARRGDSRGDSHPDRRFLYLDSNCGLLGYDHS